MIRVLALCALLVVAAVRAQSERLAAALATAPNLALRKPVSASGHWGPDVNEHAVDGVLAGSWWGCENIPVWLSVDLGTVAAFNSLRVLTYWGPDRRYYQYHVEVSPDGAQWTRVVDMTGNTAPGTAYGRLFRFEGVQARYVRTTFTRNSVGNGTGGHLVEIEVRNLAPEAAREAEEAMAELNRPSVIDACLADPHRRLTQDAAPAPWAPPRVAARNSHVALQAYLRDNRPAFWVLGGGAARAVDEQADRIRLVLNDFVGAAGARIPAAAVQARFVGWVPLDGRPVAEPLLEADYLATPAGQVQPLWLTVHVPKDIPPGRYTGALRVLVESGSQRSGEVAVLRPTLDVLPLVLTDGPELGFGLDLWQHSSNLARAHGVRRWSEEHWRVIEAYAADLASRGQKAAMVCIGETPWGGQGCASETAYPSDLYEYSTIRGEVQPDGQVRFDFDRFDRYVQTYLKQGVSRRIECYGLHVTQHDPTSGATRPVSPADQERFWAEFTAHLKQRGWLERTQIGFDEPTDHEGFLKTVRHLRQVAPGLRIKVACNSIEFARATVQEIDDVCFYWGVATANRAELDQVVALYHQRGGEVTWYLCCGPGKPNTFLSSPLLEARLIPWLNEELGLDGYLRWAHHCYPADPWHRPQWRWAAGDMFLVYPGAAGGPVSSVRWEMLREGIEDYECLRQLALQAQRAAPAAQAALRQVRQEAIARVTGSPSAPLDYVTDGATVDAARRAVLEALAPHASD